MFSDSYRQVLKNRYEWRMERLEALGKPGWTAGIREKTDQVLEEDIKEALWYLYGAMPVEDAVDLSFCQVLEFARHGAWLFQEGPFRGMVPEEMFCEFVLGHRVNDEAIRPCRKLFYETFCDSVQEGNFTESVLKLNYRCAEEVSYRLTDDRTAAAVSVYRWGFGRCGEESTFAVNVLRSVGIPARQVYVPYWSHCDDNHAWVETWTGDGWHFFGACEPEECLNQGWFNRAAGRAMAVTYPAFGAVREKDTRSPHMQNELERYARTKQLTVRVFENSGRAASGAEVKFCVLNGAFPHPVLTRMTDDQGKVLIQTGYGSLCLRASKKDLSAEALIAPDQKDVMMILQQGADPDESKVAKGIFYPPAGNALPVQDCLTKEEKENGRRKKEAAKEKWQQKLAGLKDPKQMLIEAVFGSCGKLNRLQEGFLEGLSEKDFRDADPEVLRCQYEEGMKKKRVDVPEDIFIRFVLNPRIDGETLTPWQKELIPFLSDEFIETCHRDKRAVAAFVEDQVKERPDLIYDRLITSPAGTLGSGMGSRKSRRILAVALLRSMGIPARLSGTYGSVEYYENGKFLSLSGLPEKKVRVMFKGEKEKWKCHVDWSLSRLAETEYELLGKLPVEEEILLVPGDYRLCTVTRLPDGSQLYRKENLCIREDTEITLTREEAKPCELLQDEKLEEFELLSPDGQVVKGSSLAEGLPQVFMWLVPGQEPTEHVLGELVKEAGKLGKLSGCLHMVLTGEEALEDRSVKKVLSVLPKMQVHFSEDDVQTEKLARSMFTDPGKFPLILMIRQDLRGIYAVSGYNIGTVEMLEKIWQIETEITQEKEEIYD